MSVRSPFSWNRATVEVEGGPTMDELRVVVVRQPGGTFRATAFNHLGVPVGNLEPLDIDASDHGRKVSVLIAPQGTWTVTSQGCGC